MNFLKNASSLLIAIVIVSAMAACSSTSSSTTTNHLEDLHQMMTGSFNSSQQAASDSDYFDISLHMYPIWESAEDKKYLYVEQAVSAMQDRPYRQRIYELTQVDETVFASKVFTLPEPENYINKWDDASNFDELKPEDLEEREGCTVFLTLQDDGSFSGSTNQKDCKSTLRGAAYATSIVEILPDQINSWDQGFDSTDIQVWGATKGGYEFIRIAEDGE